MSPSWLETIHLTFCLNQQIFSVWFFFLQNEQKLLPTFTIIAIVLKLLVLIANNILTLLDFIFGMCY